MTEHTGRDEKIISTERRYGVEYCIGLRSYRSKKTEKKPLKRGFLCR
jgi:hypothetical protein